MAEKVQSISNTLHQSNNKMNSEKQLTRSTGSGVKHNIVECMSSSNIVVDMRQTKKNRVDELFLIQPNRQGDPQLLHNRMMRICQQEIVANSKKGNNIRQNLSPHASIFLQMSAINLCQQTQVSNNDFDKRFFPIGGSGVHCYNEINATNDINTKHQATRNVIISPNIQPHVLMTSQFRQGNHEPNYINEYKIGHVGYELSTALNHLSNVEFTIHTTGSSSSSHCTNAIYAQETTTPSKLPFCLAQPVDKYQLSEHQYFLRFQIEAFQATDDDVKIHTRGRNKRITLGQVGIRCRHCAHLPVSNRQKGSAYFPANTMGLYQAAQNMSTAHIQCGLCTEMPEYIKDHFKVLIATKAYTTGAGRPYWDKSAKEMGLVNTENGIRSIYDLPTPAAHVTV